MIDKKPQITEFIQENFSPGTLKDNDFTSTTSNFLDTLFQIFPTDCIDTDDLFDILTTLNYKPFRQAERKYCWCFKEV